MRNFMCTFRMIEMESRIIESVRMAVSVRRYSLNIIITNKQLTYVSGFPGGKAIQMPLLDKMRDLETRVAQLETAVRGIGRSQVE